MKIVTESGIKKLVPTEKKYLISKEDLEKPIEERYYFEFAYLPKDMTVTKCKELYEEIDKEGEEHDESSI